MNTINFQNTGGFPLETETLDEMQSAYNLLQSLGNIVGEKSIIKGCKVVGTTITDGVIYVNGELLEFRGGQEQTTIIVIEEVVSAEFEDGAVNPVYHTRYATFGTGLNSILWADFVRAFPLTSALFIDEVRMYAGDIANIPWGWYLMDGTNGTMDIRDKFPVPYNTTTVDYDAIGKTGGLKEVTLTEAEMPIHKHTGSTFNSGSHRHRLKDGSGGEKTNSITSGGGNLAGQDNPTNWVDDNTILETAGEHTHNLNMNNKGGGNAHENRPPFIVVGFIQFKGV
jgi:microcystin-dependent protein